MENYGKSSIVSIGPWGGEDGVYWDDGVHSAVRQVEIAHGTGIDSIRVEYDHKGTSVWSEKHGGQGGNKTDKVKLDYPEEFLTALHGHYGSLKGWGPVLIKSLTLISNKKTYGPYGTEEGTSFSLPVMGGKIVGFHGRGGWYLDAIGVHFEHTLLLHKQNPQNSMVQFSQTSFTSTENHHGYSVMEGNLGKQYDVVIALRQKDSNYNSNSNNHSLPNYFSRKNQLTVVDEPPKQKVVPPTIKRVPSKDVPEVYTYDPWGGTGGTQFDDSIYDGVRQIKVKRNVGIASIQVCYDHKGQPVWGNKNGGSGSFKKDLIVFDYPSEILTHITGHYGPTMVMGPVIIRSLSFHTTKTKYGPYGEEQGTPFSTNLKEGKIVGFHGRKGLFLDAIGVHVKEGKVIVLPVPPSPKVVPPVTSPSHKVVHPKHFSKNSAPVEPEVKVVPPVKSPTKVVPPAIVPTNPTTQRNEIAIKVDAPKWSFMPGRRGGAPEEGIQRIIKDPAPHGTGPWGGEGGKPWDDGVFSGIRQIILTLSNSEICSIEIEYDRNGQSVWSVPHGGTRGQKSQRVKLEFPHEVLTCISGYYGPINNEEGVKVIKSMTFQTSRRKHGPFGEELGTFFTSARTEGKVVGFHGRSSMFLDAIGVHMQHWLGNQKPKHSSIMRIFS